MLRGLACCLLQVAFSFLQRFRELKFHGGLIKMCNASGACLLFVASCVFFSSKVPSAEISRGTN